MAVSPEKFLRVFLAAALLGLGLASLDAEPRVDNVLGRMVPPGATSLVGAHMDQIKQTELYRKLMASQNLRQVDQFAAETGFDPRRDVREVLYVSIPRGSVLLARGTFHVQSEKVAPSAKKIRHGEYTIVTTGTSGYAILDASLAAAGDVPAIEAALDEWKSGTHTGAQALIAQASAVSPQAQFWGISTGAGNFLAEHPPGVNTGLDFSKIFHGMQDTWFETDLSGGLKAEVHGTTATEKDAQNLRDAVKGMVGLGRLNVPDNQPELLKVWDGITVDQMGRSFTMRADIPQDLIDRMVATMMRGAGRAPKQVR